MRLARAAGVESETSSSGLRRELGLRDLSLFAVICIVGTRWIPAAAHTGPGAVLLWVLAALFFAVPLAVTVAALTVKYKGVAGGFYVWTRHEFGPWHAFLCFWIYWTGLTFWLPGAALFYMSAGFQALGPAWAGLADSRAALLAVTLAAIWIALGTNLVGLKIGKWTQSFGAIAAWLLVILLAVVAFEVWGQRGPATALDVIPHWDWRTLSFWAAIAYAMTGLELASLMGAEIHDPERTLPRAGWIASATAVLFYSVATISMLVILPPGGISEMNGFAQAGGAAGTLLGISWLAPLIAALVMASALGQIGGIGTAVSRLPFAAGVDQLLPAAFARVHPRWHTPHVSILAFGAVSSFLLVAMQLGDSMRAAYQELVSLTLIGGFLPFVYMFASAWKAGRRLSSISGLAITLLAVVCSAVPTAEVAHVGLFEFKLALGTAAMIGSARLLYNRHAGRIAAAGGQ
jgi:amino acid transporter